MLQFSNGKFSVYCPSQSRESKPKLKPEPKPKAPRAGQKKLHKQAQSLRPELLLSPLSLGKLTRNSQVKEREKTVKDRQKVRQTDEAEIAKGKSPQCQLFLLPGRAYIKCVACIWKTVG